MGIATSQLGLPSYRIPTEPVSKLRQTMGTAVQINRETGLLLSRFSGSFLLRRVRLISQGKFMDISVRSYLTAGVAVVGATAITMAPVQVLPADLQLRGERMVAVLEDVSLASLADLIAAAQKAISPVGQGVETSAAAAGNVIRDVGNALTETVASGVAGGGTAFRAIVDGLLAQGSTLATAIDAAIAAFPPRRHSSTPSFRRSPPSTSTCRSRSRSRCRPPSISASASTPRPSPRHCWVPAPTWLPPSTPQLPTSRLRCLRAAVATALSGVFPGLSSLVTDGGAALANLVTTLATTLASGIDLGGSAFEVLLSALQNGGSALAAAFSAAIASFANPELFVDAFLDVLAAVNAPLARPSTLPSTSH